MKIQNNFLQAKVNKDFDERLIPNGQLTDAENFMVTSEDGGAAGVGKVVLGNFKTTSLNIPGAMVIGSMSDDANNRLFYFIKGTNHDYLIEYNVETETTIVVLKSAVGGALNFSTSYRIYNVNFVVNSENENTILAWTDGYNPPRIVNIDRFKALFAADPAYVFTSLEISVIKPSPETSPTIQGRIDAENLGSNEIEDKMISFSYRYKYNDGYYSAISQWSEYFFYPNVFSLNFETMENVGMLNQYNYAYIYFNTGDRDVIGIDVFFKNSGSSTVYVVDKFIKKEELWDDNTTQSVSFSNNKIYSTLPESQYFRSFDNVPLTANIQTIAGNRLMYGDYVEGRNLIDEFGGDVLLDYSVGYVSQNLTEKEIDSSSFAQIEGIFPTSRWYVSFTFPDYVTYKNGTSIQLKLRIKSNYVGHEDNFFTDYYTYIFLEDFDNFNDFFANSSFVSDIQDALSASFVSAMSEPPLGFVLSTYEEFVVTNPSPKKIDIKLPSITYIKNNPDPTPDEFEYEYFEPTSSNVYYREVGVNSSMKSNRSYEICMYYEDQEGRKTTALTSANNTTYIPASSSDNKNIIKVSIPNSQKPPVWAKRYGFAIKQNRRDYETIYANQFFYDENKFWILIKGQTKDKINVGDELIVKRDKGGVLSNVVKTRVLSLSDKAENFLPDNRDSNNTLIIEPSGFYAELDGTYIDYQYSENEFIEYSKAAGTVYGRPTVVIDAFNDGTSPLAIPQGSIITFNFRSDYRDDPPRILFNKTYISSKSYDRFEDFFNEEILPLGFTSTSDSEKEYNVTLGPTNVTTGKCALSVEGTEAGVQTLFSSFYGRVYVDISIRITSGVFIFETLPKENDSIVYFETPEIYQIVNGEHQLGDHLLTRTFNCFSFGNGAESNQIKDSFNKQKLLIDFCPTSTTEDKYKQISRYADITYSDIYQSSTSVNRLNEFNLSVANYKDDIDKRFGRIVKMHPTETDILVIQEDKWSKILYGKDLLYNSDATTNLSRIQNVLGQQVPYGGEYGISTHAESFDEYGRNMFCTDVKRGVVLRFNDSNGLTEISNSGMKDYFKRLFRDNKIDNIIGQYDSFYDIYICNIKYTTKTNESKYVTWVYSTDADGFATKQTFNPEEMLRVNNHLLSFKNGEVYKHNHNATSNYNTFYGVQSDSTFSFNFSQEPSTRKSFKTIEIEGTNSWDITLKTDLQNGYLNKGDLSKKEGVWYGYVRGEGENAVDTATLSVQGLGSVSSIVGNVVTINGFSSGLVSVGDRVLDSNLVFIGNITSILGQTITLSSVVGASVGTFLVSSKSQSSETSGLLGYYMKVDAKLSSNTYSEVYSVNSEAIKSFS
jgi:hypothetical protein